MSRTITKFILHHTAGSLQDTAKSVSDAHQRRNWGSASKPVYAEKSSLGWYGQYHYFIDKTGKLTQFRKEDEIGWHAGNWFVNKTSIGVCLAGNFQHETPTEEQLNALSKLMHNLQDRHDAEWFFHKDIKSTACPGAWWSKEKLNAVYERTTTKDVINIVDIKLYKPYNSPKIYLAGKDGKYHHILNEEVFKAFFGSFKDAVWMEGPELKPEQVSFSINGK